MAVTDTESPEMRRALAPGGTLDALPDDFDVLGARYSGKVRENFTRGGERLILVTDRVSAFDVVLGTIPFKGQVLNGLARFWFDATAGIFPNHMLGVPDPQAMRAVECAPIPVEFVVRGYLTGVSDTSIARAYERGERTFCGHALPDGLRRHEKLPRSLLTPSTKAPKGEHDISVSRDWLVERGLIDRERYDVLERRCLALFEAGQKIAAERGLILVDTKYELGVRPDGEVVLIDEIHTPDSSRYWYADSYAEAMARGEDPRSLDKEYLRRWLVSQGFRGEGRPPVLPDEIRAEAARRYIEVHELITGRRFEPDTEPPVARLRRNLGLPQR
ncbi:phosphoribosylaminoimidazolesuccinocarboxamide synthase [Nannocystis punicea]|uniref:Phosphoribosylaminoimidazole-succinocarboxamide synthase n=1 Tax=Nannocystis punicea TaxID=2995304 RepID=A0ABY7HEY3_9BACT|nr:phosphoribosylaminoimidazolesuccinocarboxamide synthase [Nannocystis poenicansa]WAS97645.1 phosphoribosylaminoimidazolesuccinocarboxamide synthase [Nannocystis poenicansa]